MKERKTGYKSDFEKKRVQWIFEHSTSYQLLCCIDNEVLRNSLLHQIAPQ
jgi:hypothetical protein